MGYGYRPTPEQIEAQQEQHQQRIKDDHDEKLEEQANGGKTSFDRNALRTQFMQEGIPELRKMILDSDPDAIYEASLSWKQVHNILSGGDGDGASGGVDAVSSKDSVAGMLQTAVDNVMEHWEGDAARAFQRKAGEITQKVVNGGAFANLASAQMDAVQKDLRAAKEKMRDVKVPSGWDSFWNKMGDSGGRDDAMLKEDVKNGVSADAARKANEEMLSAGKEAQLQGVAVMESLAANYQVYAKNLNSQAKHDPKDPFAPPSNDVTMPPPVTMPSPSGGAPGAAGSAPKPWSAGGASKIGAAPSIPRAKGITGGAPLPPTTRTNVDSIKPGLTGPGLSPGPVGGGGGGGGGGGAMPPGGIAPIGGPGLGGSGGRSGIGGPGRGISPAARSGVGAPGGRSGLSGGPGGAGANRGTGGRAGMGGMGGGAGAGAAGRGGAAAGGRGALAKARGGVVGAAKAPTGKGTGAGAGLHGSRGGSQRGGMAGGMAGGMGRGNGRRPEDENSRGERPDYLVEDEETWISEEDRKRNVPRNIE
ncbi:hypothetical protein [Streptomyces chryseus]|uniref:hypothetical protein n=1 Tax=Streptomyces chryseus TaxID=68186 RepID=UPI00110FE60F|nr:hypothetical protein [Streptomyces chryseus]GGX34600.1 hypothetical protein GCM10010353_57050 [Streptomyces chryseus]